MKKIYLLFFIILVISCSTQEKDNPKPNKDEEVPSGGPCSYQYDTIPVVILEITAESATASDLILQKCYPYEDSIICDTVYYSNIMNRNIENSELEKLKLKSGDTIVMQMGTITEGHCNPENDYIELQKYNR